MKRDEDSREDMMDDDDFDDSLDDPSLESELKDDLIEEWCPVCREMKPHAIVKGDRIACAACNHEHRRETEDEGEIPAFQTILSSEDRATQASLHAAWQRLTEGNEGNALPYSIRLQLSEGEIVTHSKFGLGIVVEMTDTTKAEILFEDGLHRLICGKSR